jgi:hypothetical protein
MEERISAFARLRKSLSDFLGLSNKERGDKALTEEQAFPKEESLLSRLSRTQGISEHEAEQLEAKTNMLAADITKMAELSATNGVILGFRPVGEASLRLMKENGAVGKPLAIKGKSASEGKYLQGLIPVDSAFSKIGSEAAPSAERIKQFNHKTEKMLHEYSADEDAQKKRLNAAIKVYIEENVVKDDLAKIPKFLDNAIKSFIEKNEIKDVPAYIPKWLRNITKTYIKENEITKTPEKFLPSMPHTLSTSTLTDDKGNAIYGFKDENGLPLKDKNGKIIFAIEGEAGGFKHEANGASIDIPSGYKAQKIEVVSYQRWGEKEASPITADYDQFVAAVPRSEAYKDEKVVSGAKGYDPKVFGNATESGAVITTALRVDTASSMAIHHSQETFNPFPEPIKGQHVFFIPIEKNGKITSEVRICQSEQEVLALYNTYEKSHSMAINPLWGWTRDDKDQLTIDPKRISSIELATNFGAISEEGNKEKTSMAEKMIATLRSLGEAKVMHQCKERDAKIQGLESQLATDHKIFQEKYPGSVLIPEKELLTKQGITLGKETRFENIDLNGMLPKGIAEKITNIDNSAKIIPPTQTPIVQATTSSTRSP